MSKIDKSSWGNGDWIFEPDFQNGVDDNSGYPMLIVRIHGSGHLCGYVGVHDSHPFHGKDYDDEALQEIDVHGGLTYSSDSGPGQEPDGFWWFGFDCAHAGDLAPGMATILKGTYRNLAYVQDECAKLAKQLYELSNDKAVAE